MLKKIIILCSIVTCCFSALTAQAMISPYVTYFLSVEPPIDCIELDGPGVRNNCDQILYLDNEILYNDTFHNAHLANFQGPRSFSMEPGDTETWVKKGKLGNTDITFHGETRHIADPNPGELYRLILVIIFVVLSFFGGYFLVRNKLNIILVIPVIILSFIISSVCALVIYGIIQKPDSPHSARPIVSENPTGHMDDILLNEKALEKGDENFCLGVKNENLRIACSALARKDASLCKNISSEDTSDWCIKKIAIKNRDYQVCGSMVNAKVRDFCYINIATSINSPHVCQYISSISRFAADRNHVAGRPRVANRDQCYHLIANQIKKAELCGCIEDESAFEECNLRIFGGMRSKQKFMKPSEKPRSCFE